MKINEINVKNLLDSKGVKPSQLAKRLGVDQSMMCRWYNGDSKPKVFSWIVLLMVFDELDWDDFNSWSGK